MRQKNTESLLQLRMTRNIKYLFLGLHGDDRLVFVRPFEWPVIAVGPSLFLHCRWGQHLCKSIMKSVT